jgi:hypothetical protein
MRPIWRRALLVAGLFIVLVAVSLAVRARTLSFGVHTLHPQDQELQRVRDLGAQYVVQVFAWSEIEPSPGEYHWEYTDWLLRAAEYYDLRIVARLDKPPAWAAPSTTGLSAPPKSVGDYADFVGQVATRYRGHIAAYIIWNEPNLAREWGTQRPDPAAYTALLQAASTRIRSIGAGARILSAGLAPTDEHSELALDDRDFLRAMYAAGARGSFDILAAHPYGFANPPEDPHGAHDGLNFARLQDLRDIMVENGDVGKPVWITEFGYTTAPPAGSAGLRVTEEQQGQYLTRAFEIARERWDWVQMFTVWNLTGVTPPQGNDATTRGAQGATAPGNAPGDDSLEQAGYSLDRADGSLKPAYTAVRALSKESTAAAVTQTIDKALLPHPASGEFLVLARDSIVHLGDSEYPPPWVPLYRNRNPSTDWEGEFYLREPDLQGARGEKGWTLTMELMQVNDYDSRVLVNDQPTRPAYLPTEDFTAIWATAQFQVPASVLHVGRNLVTLRDGRLFPAFQQLGFTWDDFQVRDVILRPP